MTPDHVAGVSSSVPVVSVRSVHQFLARIVASTASPGRWLTELMDEADDIWDLSDDDDLGYVSAPTNGIA